MREPAFSCIGPSRTPRVHAGGVTCTRTCTCTRTRARTRTRTRRPEGLGVNRGRHNALDAVWVGSQWSHARHAPCGPAAKRLLSLRQRLYESKTLQMHGKNRSMLLGYRADNSKGNSPKPAYDYTPNPASRYNMVPS